MMIKVDSIAFADGADEAGARHWAEVLGFHLFDQHATADLPSEATDKPYLLMQGGCLSLFDPKENQLLLQVDFVDGATAERKRRASSKTERLLQALGRDTKKLTIIDACAGLGQDALLLASAGHAVTLVERHPVMAALLADGVARLQAFDPAFELTVVQQDACSYFQTLIAADEQVDVVYLDPMHPSRRKSALVKKRLRIVRQLVGDDPDAAALVLPALACARNRVVIKRPRLSEALGGQPPTYCLQGRSSRFDVLVKS